MNILTQKQIEAFWGKVDKDNSNHFYENERCWIWIAYCNLKGYGVMRLGIKTELAHRVSWIIAHGEIPDNLDVLHHCDNPRCIRPSHIWLGTHQENMRDMMMKGRGNQLSGDNHPARLHPETRARGDTHFSRLHPEKLARGENNGSSKLTWEQVREIRRRYAPWGRGGDNSTTLAKEFGVSHVNILDIVKNVTWRE